MAGKSVRSLQGNRVPLLAGESAVNVVPMLGDLVADPGKVALLPPEAIPGFLGELARLKATLWARLMLLGNGQRLPATLGPAESAVIDSKELSRRWNVPESWIRDSVRSRSGDPIPCIRMGRYVRFEWGSTELEAWFDRRREGKKKPLDKKKV